MKKQKVKIENSPIIKEPPRKLSFLVSEITNGERLDKHLADKIPDLSRSYIKKIITEGFVLVNGVGCRPSRHLNTGEVIEVTIPQIETQTIEPEDISIDVVYEDESLIVIDKPQGLVVHPGAGNKSGTLISALLFQKVPLAKCGPEDRPGIVHRIDKDTSGLIVVAKTDLAYEGLSQQFRDHTTERIYVGICWGRLKLDSGVIDAPLSRHPKNRKKITASQSSGKEAITEFTVLERFNSLTYAEFRLKTGRTHQIRVHMAHIGHPICGDRTYGSMKAGKLLTNQKIRMAVLGLKRQALHARVLGFVHPVTGEDMRFTSNIPDDIEGLLGVLRSEG